jgi:hypothetical protein
MEMIALDWLLSIFGKDFWHFNVMELFASIAIIIGAIWAVVGWVKERKRKKRQKEIRDTISQLFIEGNELKNRCFEKNTKAPVEETEQWNEKAVKYLEANLGRDYAERFQSHEGLPVGVTTLSGMQANVESFIKTRLARLNEFLSELNRFN